jgi:hypothetical protein
LRQDWPGAGFPGRFERQIRHIADQQTAANAAHMTERFACNISLAPEPRRSKALRATAMAETFVRRVERACVRDSVQSGAQPGVDQLPRWLDHDNHLPPDRCRLSIATRVRRPLNA